ncbi:MAG: transporter [Micrococcales bacterium]|nr:MAG: transporter [Micrococcales bacterium]
MPAPVRTTALAASQAGCLQFVDHPDHDVRVDAQLAAQFPLRERRVGGHRGQHVEMPGSHVECDQCLLCTAEEHLAELDEPVTGTGRQRGGICGRHHDSSHTAPVRSNEPDQYALSRRRIRSWRLIIGIAYDLLYLALDLAIVSKREMEAELFALLADTARRRARLVVGIAVVTAALAGVFGAGVAEDLGVEGITADDAESSVVTRTVEDFDPGADPDVVLVVSTAETVTGARADIGNAAWVSDGLRLTSELAALPHVEGVTSFWQTPADALRSTDGRSALVTAHISGSAEDANTVVTSVKDRLAMEGGDLVVRVTGGEAVRQELQQTIAEDLLRAELIALPVSALVLYFVFGGVLAATLPLGVGIFAILGTNAVLRIVSGVTEVSVFALNLTTALGLGLAIDYALLIVRRFREELDAGVEPAAAVRTTVATAGRTVAFSAVTVAAALSTMLIFPLYFLRSFAYAGVAVVILSALAALVVLPAALILLSGRLGPKPGSSQLQDPGRGRWARWARFIMDHRFFAGLAVIGFLLLLAGPFTSVAYGQADDRQLPATSDTRVAQQIIRDDFDPAARPIATLVAPSGTSPDQSRELAARIKDLPGVHEVLSAPQESVDETVSEDERDQRDGHEPVFLRLVADEGIEPTSQRAQDLVADVRARLDGTGVLVGGQPAEIVDSRTSIADGMPLALFIAVVSALVIVFLLTGSILLPVQAVVANGLSLTAMLGAIVWVFQDGNMSGLLGFTPTGYIETTIPILMGCVAFGLSMDYGVFLLARIVEERQRLGDDRESVAIALQRTGGVITAAALILATVLIAIGSSRVTNTKMLGLGVALAVLMDAFVVRTSLVPALAAMMGRYTWWAPAWLKSVHDRIGWREAERGVPVTGTDHDPLNDLGVEYPSSGVGRARGGEDDALSGAHEDHQTGEIS